MKSETRPAIITVVTLVFAPIQSGIIATVPTKGVISSAKAIPRNQQQNRYWVRPSLQWLRSAFKDTIGAESSLSKMADTMKQ